MGIKIPDQINWDSGTVREGVHTYQIALKIYFIYLQMTEI